MPFTHKKRVNTSIPNASMPDIIFMLIFFFMATSVLKQYSGLNVILPKAKQIEKLASKVHVAQLWVDKEGRVSVDGKLVSVNSLRNIFYEKRKVDPQLIVSIRADERINMEQMAAIHNELRLADALKVNYSTKTAI